MRQLLISCLCASVILALVSLIGQSDATASTDAPSLVRVGEHSDFVRVVIESPNELEFRSTLGADGLSATIVLSRLRLLTPLPHALSPIETMRATYDQADDTMTLSLHFSKPVRLAETLRVPPSGHIRHRLALDYALLAAALPAASAPVATSVPATQTSGPVPALQQAVHTSPAAAASPAAQTPAPVTVAPAAVLRSLPAAAGGHTAPSRGMIPGTAAASPPPDLASVTPQAGSPQAADAADEPSLASILGALHFGSSEDQTVQAIAVQFGTQVAPVRAATRNSRTGERKLFVSFIAPIGTLGPAHAIYQFDPNDRALLGVQFDWGDSFGSGLTTDQREALTKQVTVALSAVGFQRASAIIDAATPSDGWLVYSGANGADLRTQIWAIPAVQDAAAAGDPRFVLRVAFVPSAPRSP